MTQKTLEFPHEIKTGTKYLVYSSVQKSRVYHYVDETGGWFSPTKKETRVDEQIVGIVDNEHDIELMSKFVKEKAVQSCYQWTVDKISFRAIPIEHYEFT